MHGEQVGGGRAKIPVRVDVSYFAYSLLTRRILYHYAAGVARGAAEGRQHYPIRFVPTIFHTTSSLSLSDPLQATLLQAAQHIGLDGGWDQRLTCDAPSNLKLRFKPICEDFEFGLAYRREGWEVRR